MMLDQKDQQIRYWVGNAIQITADGLKKCVFTAYKIKYPVSYMDEIQEKLKNDAGHYPADIFTSDDLLLKKLDDPKVWFDLMARRWDNLFQRRSGTQGRTHVSHLRELRDKWAHYKPISLQEAISGIEAAINLLGDFKCDQCLRDVQAIRAELSKLETDFVTGFRIEADHPALLESITDETVKTREDDTELFQPIRENDELQLEIIEHSGGLRNLKVPVQIGRVIVGRGNTAHVSLNDCKVSRVHLMLAQSAKPGLMLTDLRSANGTLLEGKRLAPNEPTQWGIGQVITVGSTWIVLRRGCE
jgi:hypothetical protein